MKPTDFVAKWSASRLGERQGSQEHFIDLCNVLGQPTPGQDSSGENYCFERGASISGGGNGWADVWRRGCFGWEYKGKHKDLKAALRQLVTYSLDLESPPYLVVSDMERIEIHSNWTNTVTRTWELTLPDLLDPAKLDLLRQVFEGSEKLKPGQTPQELTAKVAAKFGKLGRDLQERGHHPRAVAHFLNRLVFCMFAEDAKLLPDGLFSRVIKGTMSKPELAQPQLTELFNRMAVGGFFGADAIKFFNGGLFDGGDALPLTKPDLQLIFATADEHKWDQIDPAIFGTLFEQALHATRERPALGAHYTDREKILKIVEPTIIRPLTKEWEEAKAKIAGAMGEAAAAEARRKAVLVEAAEALKEKGAAAKEGEAKRRRELKSLETARTAAFNTAKTELEAFLDRLDRFRVLDPACGSGNFLYVALHALKDIELRALVDAERMGIAAPAPRVGLKAVKGIEIEPYAAELARVTLWIGDLQWQIKNGFSGYTEPILSSLDQIECRDALLNPDGTEAEWPEADVIIGNPPFLGNKSMLSSLGEEYVNTLRETYAGRLSASVEFVTYWFDKALVQVLAHESSRVGLVATQAIRRGANKDVLNRISGEAQIFDAWSDEPWAIDGAAVRVSMVCFGRPEENQLLSLDGKPAVGIMADLTSHSIDSSEVAALTQNRCVCWQGTIKGGSFEIDYFTASKWLTEPLNPNGRPNSDAVRMWINGGGITDRNPDTWIVDFGCEGSLAEAQYFESPFQHILRTVKPVREKVRRENHKKYWWRHAESRPGMRQSLKGLRRFIGTPRVSKYRVFVWLDSQVIPDSRVNVFAREDHATFGILHSRIHELWSLWLGGWHGVGNDPQYTPALGFETFPFPEGLTPNIPAAQYADDPRAKAIAEAAAELNRLRENWLNPADLVTVVPEVVPTAAPGEAPVKYPDRILPKDDAAAKELKKRTLTNLYNQRPQWLANAHAKLDEAVAAAYGWPADLSDEQVLERLFALNQERAAAGR